MAIEVSKGPGGCMKLRLLNEYIQNLNENEIILVMMLYFCQMKKKY